LKINVVSRERLLLRASSNSPARRIMSVAVHVQGIFAIVLRWLDSTRCQSTDPVTMNASYMNRVDRHPTCSKWYMLESADQYTSMFRSAVPSCTEPTTEDVLNMEDATLIAP
jgi:hypothetical protein